MTTTATVTISPPALPRFEYEDLLHHPSSLPDPHNIRHELKTNGYVVVPAIPRDEALAIRDRALTWLESFNYGFDKRDPSTFKQQCLPIFQKAGMYFSYGIHHEQWVWDIRTAPGVVSAFQVLWGTTDIITSFDGGSLMLPGIKLNTSENPNWEHIDAHPERRGFFVAQGLVNINDNGPDDGGLLVMKGSSRLMDEFFDLHGRPPLPTNERIDWHAFSQADKQWFLDRGCEWIKVCANPGDLILWSSMTMHQNSPPRGTRDRICTYVCMGPSHLLTPHDKQVRLYAWKNRLGTTHTPFQGCYTVIEPPIIRPETGLPDPLQNARMNTVVVTDQVKKLVGIDL